jgi:hypothetical protein
MHRLGNTRNRRRRLIIRRHTRANEREHRDETRQQRSQHRAEQARLPPKPSHSPATSRRHRRPARRPESQRANYPQIRATDQHHHRQRVTATSLMTPTKARRKARTPGPWPGRNTPKENRTPATSVKGWCANRYTMGAGADSHSTGAKAIRAARVPAHQKTPVLSRKSGARPARATNTTRTLAS